MDIQIGAIITRVMTRRTHAPIRRNSKPAGKCEAGFWRPTTRKTVNQIVLAAKRYEIARKAPGARNGPLGVVALEVLELLANKVDFPTGRLDPSIDYLKKMLRRSRDAIVRALAALRDHGFVDWLRRFETAESAGDRGPQVKQTSNAYRLSLPAAARALLGRYYSPSPMPDDRAQEDATRAAEAKDALQSIPRDERIEATIEDPAIAGALTKLSRLIGKQRESAKQTESGSSYIIDKRTPLFGPLTRPCGGSEPRN